MIPRAILAALAFAVTTVMGASWAQSHVYESGPLTISHPWARASAPTARNGAAYLKIESAAGAKDKLIGARTPVAETVEIHETTVTDGIARMRRVPALEVTPDHPADLAPGGVHLMLFGLKTPLKEGEMFILVLIFEKAGDVSIDAIVESPGAMGPHGMAGTAMPEHHPGAETMHKH